MLCLRFSDIGISLGLEECRASFEASLREAPPDEVAHPMRPRPSLHGIVTALLHAYCVIER